MNKNILSLSLFLPVETEITGHTVLTLQPRAEIFATDMTFKWPLESEQLAGSRVNAAHILSAIDQLHLSSEEENQRQL